MAIAGLGPAIHLERSRLAFPLLNPRIKPGVTAEK